MNHDVLISRVASLIKDKRVPRLIGKYLRAGVVVNGRLEATAMGVPQGGPLSPLLANILLDDLDKELERRGHCFSRKGPWHLSRPLATQAGMTNNWLYSQGLISVKDQWVKIHYPISRIIV